MTTDLQDYFSLQDKITALEAEVTRLRGCVHDERELKNRCLARPHTPTRTYDATVLVRYRKFEGTLALADIADFCCICEGTVRDISSQINTGKIT